MNASVEVFHVYIDQPRKAVKGALEGLRQPTAHALIGIAASTPDWQPVVMVDDYFVHARPLDEGSGCLRVPAEVGEPSEHRKSEERRPPTSDEFAADVTSCWVECWTEARAAGVQGLETAPELIFVLESAFEEVAYRIAERLAPVVRTNTRVEQSLDGAAWRRPGWLAGPVGAWLSNGRPPRTAPPRSHEAARGDTTLHAAVAAKQSIHLDIELFDCDACRFGGRCPGFGRCEATDQERRGASGGLRMSCPILAAAFQLARVGERLGGPEVPAHRLDGDRLVPAGTLPVAARAFSVLESKFLDVEHSVSVIREHLPSVDAPPPEYVLVRAEAGST